MHVLGEAQHQYAHCRGGRNESRSLDCLLYESVSPCRLVACVALASSGPGGLVEKQQGICVGRSKLTSREPDARLDRLLTGTCKVFLVWLKLHEKAECLVSKGSKGYVRPGMRGVGVARRSAGQRQ